MRIIPFLAALGFSFISGCANPENCAEYTTPLQNKVAELERELGEAKSENERINKELAELKKRYEARPETIAINDLAESYPCMYVNAWNTPAYHDMIMHNWNGVAYDFAVVPVLEDHGTMVKSIDFDETNDGFVTVLWFEKKHLTNKIEDTPYYDLNPSEAMELSNTGVVTCQNTPKNK